MGVLKRQHQKAAWRFRRKQGWRGGGRENSGGGGGDQSARGKERYPSCHWLAWVLLHLSQAVSFPQAEEVMYQPSSPFFLCFEGDKIDAGHLTGLSCVLETPGNGLNESKLKEPGGVMPTLITDQKEIGSRDQKGQNGRRLMSGKTLGMRSPRATREEGGTFPLCCNRTVLSFLKETRKH